MKLELNLLRIDGIDASVGASLEKKYVEVTDSFDPNIEVLNFLKECTSYFDSTDIAKNIKSATMMSAIDFQCINYILNEISLTVMVRLVTEEIELMKDSTEVVLTNYNDIQYGWIPTATVKLVADEDLDVEEVFRTIDEAYELFDHEIFKGLKDPFIEQVDNIVPAQIQMDGQVPRSLVNYCNSIISYIGIEIFRIVPKGE